MRNRRIRYFCLILVLSMILSGASVFAAKSEENQSDEIIIKGSSFTASTDSELKITEKLDSAANVLETGSEGLITWEFDVKTEGYYNFAINYYPLVGKGNNIERIIRVNGEIPFNGTYSVILPRIYKNEKTGKVYDKDGNELRQVQTEAPRFTLQTLWGQNSNYSQPLTVKLHKGKNTISLEAVREPVAIDYIKIFKIKEPATYAETIKQYKATGKETAIRIEGEDAAYKTDKTLYPVSDRSDPNNSPNHISKIVMNMIGGNNWREPGQSISWNVRVDNGGLYKILIRSKQDFNPGQISSRKLMIDGAVPFKEAENLEFEYKLGFQKTVLGNKDTEYLFYLDKGEHTITLENNVGKIGTILERLSAVVARLNAAYKDVFIITGSYPDADRDYNIEIALPSLPGEIAEIEKQLNEIKNDYLAMTGTKGDGYSDMEKMLVQLKSFSEDIERLPARLDTFRINISNISSWLLSAAEQPLLIDYLDLLPQDKTADTKSTGFFKNLSYGVKSFFVSFFVDYNSINKADNEAQKSITVWLGTGRDQAQALKAIVNNEFTPKTGISVNIRLVDLGVLLPAVSANRGPDVAISLDRSLPMNYAYRGAVEELSSFKDFDAVAKRFNAEALTEFKYQDRYYALPDKYTYYMMFYRKDILKDLNIEVPTTWNQVYEIIPKLQNKHMGIGIPNIGDSNIDLFTTLLYQHDGNVYNADLSKTTLDSEQAILAFKSFTDFYTKYKVSQKIDHLTNFRTGESPIVFMPYTFFANLQAAAPEINGQWGFAQMPGTVNGDGTINRTVSASSTGSVMFQNSKSKDAAWEFLKWWTDTKAQVDFGIEIESIQGPSGRYATANTEAMQLLPWSNTELREILDQGLHTKAMPEAPGGYMTTRYIVTSSLLVINNGLVPREIIMDYNKMINDEISAMRKKFGLS